MHAYDDDTFPDKDMLPSDKDSLSSQAYLGCYYCEQLMTYSDIDTFVNGEQDALCPFCGIDSVVGLDMVVPNERVLTLMKFNHHFFG